MQGLECASPDTCCSRSCLKTLPLGSPQPLCPHTLGPWSSPTWFCADNRGPGGRRAHQGQTCEGGGQRPCEQREDSPFTHPTLPAPAAVPHPLNHMTIHLGAQDWETNPLARGDTPGVPTAAHTCNGSFSWQAPLSEFPQQREVGFP